MESAHSPARDAPPIRSVPAAESVLRPPLAAVHGDCRRHRIKSSSLPIRYGTIRFKTATSQRINVAYNTGRPSSATRPVGPSGIRARRATRPRSRARRAATPTRRRPSSPSACGAWRSAAATPTRRGAWCSGTGPRGSGSWPTRGARARSRSWTCGTPRRSSGNAGRCCGARARCDDLEEGRFAELLAALRAHVEECEAFRLGLGYFEANRERMRYDEFRNGGLCVGLGMVEAGCKTVVGHAASAPGCTGR